MRDWKRWVKAAGIRAAKTMAQTAAAMLPAAATSSEVNWKTIAGTAALAGVTSILMAIKGLPETDTYDLSAEELSDTEYHEPEDVEPDIEEEGEK